MKEQWKRGERMGVAVRIAWIGLIGALAIMPARADDIIAMISQYRIEHGLKPVHVDPQLTAVAERQAKAMAAAGELDHGVAGSFATRISSVNTDSAAENIAAGTKSWAETLRLWKASPGHNENLLRADADVIGVAVAYNNDTRFKSYWAMAVAHKVTPGKTRSAGAVMFGPGFAVAAAPSAAAVAGSTEAAREPRAPAEGRTAAEPKRAAKTAKNDKSPGLFDSLGAAIKRVTKPIRNLWN
jgi:hypothetical protein